MWFMIWIACIIATTLAAMNKGRSAFGWFCLGVLFGPLALIVVLVAGPLQPAMEQRAIESGDSKKCPYCAEVIKSEAVVCRFCGRDLPADLAARLAADFQSENERFEAWLASQQPPATNVTGAQREELRAAFDFKRRNGEL